MLRRSRQRAAITDRLEILPGPHEHVPAFVRALELVRDELDEHLNASTGRLSLLPTTFTEFLTTYTWIDDRGGEKFAPWPWQLELAEAVQRARRLIILKTRQVGVTWILSAYALYTALHPGNKCLLFSQTEQDARAFAQKSAFILRKMPEWLTPTVRHMTQQSIMFPAQTSYVRAHPSTSRAGRGVSAARLAILDEFAFHPCAQETMSAIAPAVASNPEGQLILVSTAHGVGNPFHTQWQAACQHGGYVSPRPCDDGVWRFGDALRARLENLGPADWLPVFIPWNAHPARDNDWYEREREAATYRAAPAKFAQEYPTEPEDAFVQTGRPVFDQDALRRMRASLRDPIPRARWPIELLNGPVPFNAIELRVFEHPQPGVQYYAGADVAEGLAHGDYSDLVVFRADTDTEVLSLHGHWRPDVFAEKLDIIARLYPGIYGIERNNNGLTVITECEKHLHTPGLYRMPGTYSPSHGAEMVPGRVGWVTSSVSKPIMINELEQAIRLGAIHLSDELAIPELTYYQINDNGSTGAPHGGWDDRVISRAIAWQMRKAKPAVLRFS